MKKTAVYAGTGNLYRDMITAAKSLRMNSSVDEIYFLVEHRTFPYRVPEFIHPIDVSEQRYFGINCPNIYPRWTVMTLMKAVLTKLFSDHDRILILDVDTIVDRNIDNIWDIDIEKHYLAAVREPSKSSPEKPYFNAGVMLMNLKKLRNDKVDDYLIRKLNEKAYPFAEQDCINEVLWQNILPISGEWNACPWTEACAEPRIYHFATDRKFRERPMVRKYAAMKWDEIERLRCAT